MLKFYKYLFFFLLLAASTVWLAYIFYPASKFRIIACDVGQGDAILATYNRTQILIDGGPNTKVLDCLSENIPFWDRKIELVILSHPQTDHFTGLIEVFKRYEVDLLLANSLDSGSSSYLLLKDLVGGKGIRVLPPRSKQKLRLGLIYLDILWPSDEFLSENLTPIYGNGNLADDKNDGLSNNVLGKFTSRLDPNEFSVVAIISYKNFKALLTGDIGHEVESEILSLGVAEDVNYIKVPHHGSKNGLTQDFLDAFTPEVAVITSGKNNNYGHPHKEIIELLERENIKVLRTDEEGDIISEFQ